MNIFCSTSKPCNDEQSMDYDNKVDETKDYNEAQFELWMDILIMITTATIHEIEHDNNDEAGDARSNTKADRSTHVNNPTKNCPEEHKDAGDDDHPANLPAG